jgi:hypothetical protein
MRSCSPAKVPTSQRPKSGESIGSAEANARTLDRSQIFKDLRAIQALATEFFAGLKKAFAS